MTVKGKNAGKCTQNYVQHVAWGQLMLALLTCRKNYVIYTNLSTDTPALFRAYKPWAERIHFILLFCYLLLLLSLTLLDL